MNHANVILIRDSWTIRARSVSKVGIYLSMVLYYTAYCDPILYFILHTIVSKYDTTVTDENEPQKRLRIGKK